MHTHPYEYTYTTPTPMSISKGLSTGRSRDSRSHQWRVFVDGNVAYHLTHNAGKSWKIQEKVRALGFTLVGSIPLDCPTIGLQAQSRHVLFRFSQSRNGNPGVLKNAPVKSGCCSRGARSRDPFPCSRPVGAHRPPSTATPIKARSASETKTGCRGRNGMGGSRSRGAC
jgi:hypothetical protein